MNSWPMAQPLPQSQQWAGTQLDIIELEVTEFQKQLDAEHDVALLLTHFGHSVLMEVEQISAESPVLFAFRGKVNGRYSVLLQHVSQLSFLLTTVEKPADQPHRGIGYAAKWAE